MLVCLKIGFGTGSAALELCSVENFRLVCSCRLIYNSAIGMIVVAIADPGDG